MVDEFSTVRFDRVKYSVPFNYVGKAVSIKGYGNHISILHYNVEIAHYPRSYTRGSVHYRIEHYIDLIERRPRSAYNAKSVKQALAPRIMEYGKRLEDPKEMIKLLRLCIDHGQDKVIKALGKAGHQHTASIGMITSLLAYTDSIDPIRLNNEIKVQATGLMKYDELIIGTVAV